MNTSDIGRARSGGDRQRSGRGGSVDRSFIANPDLVACLKAGARLVKPHDMRLYAGEAAGLIDYRAQAR